MDEAWDAYEQAVQLNPNLQEAVEGIGSLSALQRADRAFGGSTQPITLRFQNAKLREVFEALARAGGVNVLFDREVRDDAMTIYVKETPFNDALDMILNLNGLFARRIGPDTLLVMPNTKSKQDQYQDLMIRTFYLSNAKAKDLITLVKTMLDSKRVYVNEQLNALVIRDTPVKLHLAERIIQANDRREAEVELDVEVLEVNRTKSQQYGISFAKAAGAAIRPPGSTGGISADPTGFAFQQLTSISPHSYLFSLPASILLDFFKQDSEAKTLASPKLRVLNGKQASVNVGEKQPVLLSTTNVLPGQAATGAVPTTSTVTSIEFKDTGVKLTVEPVIHAASDITLKLKIEVTRLGDLVTLQASPEIKQFKFGTRSAETMLNLKGDEVVVLAGLIQDEERKSRVTVPGLGDIPVLGQLLSSHAQDAIQTEVILTISPKIIRNLTTPQFEAQSFWSGTESMYATSPLFTAGRPRGNNEEPLPSSFDSGPRPSRRPTDGRGQGEDGVSGNRANGEPLKLLPAQQTVAVGHDVTVHISWPETRSNHLSAIVTLAYDAQGLELIQTDPLQPGLVMHANPGHISFVLDRRLHAGSARPLPSVVFKAKQSGEIPLAVVESWDTVGARRGEPAIIRIHNLEGLP
jgi:general secretion pathway protein D